MSEMFHLTLESVPEWNLQQIHLDFEASAIPAIREVFPQADIEGCYFHLKKVCGFRLFNG